MTNPHFQKTSLDKIGIIGATLAASGWGMAGIFIQLLTDFSVFSVIAIRLTLALAMTTTTLLLFPNKFWTYCQELRHFQVWGLSSIMLTCYACGTLAFQLSTVSDVTLLMATSPIFVILFKLLQRKPVRQNEYRGASIAFLGICFIIFPGFTMGNIILKQRIVGNSLALIFSVLLAIYATWFNSLRNHLKAPNSVAVALGTFVLGSLIFFPVATRSISASINEIETRQIVALIGLGIISTAIPTLSYAIAAKRLPPLTTTSVLLLEPIFATFFAFLILREIPSVWIVPGATFVVIGLLSTHRVVLRD